MGERRSVTRVRVRATCYSLPLSTSEEFEARTNRWHRSVASIGFRIQWESTREVFAPSFRAEIDRIAAEALDLVRAISPQDPGLTAGIGFV